MLAPANQPPLSPSQVYGGVTTPSLGAAPGVTNVDIKAFVDEVMSRSISDFEKASIIVETAEDYEVSNQEIADATGYSLQQVNDFLAPVQAAKGTMGTDISLTDINNFVSDVLTDSTLTDLQRATMIAEAAADYGVSNQEIAAATGFSVQQVNEYLAPAQSADLTTASGISLTDVNNFVSGVLSDPTLTDMQRATMISEAAADYGVSNQEIALATGYTVQEVNNYLTQAFTPVSVTPVSVTPVSVTPVPVTPAPVTPVKVTPVKVTPVPPATWIVERPPQTASGVLFDDIIDFVDGVLADQTLSDKQRAQKIIDMMNAYKVTAQDIASAKGYTLKEVQDFLAQASAVVRPPQSASGVLYADINKFITDILADRTLSDKQRAQKIIDTMNAYKVTVQDIAAATGYTAKEVQDYLANATVVTSVTPSTPVPPKTASGVLYADINKFITDILADRTLSDKQRAQKIIDTMNAYKVTVQDIAAATGFTVKQVQDYLANASAPVTPTPKTPLTPVSPTPKTPLTPVSPTPGYAMPTPITPLTPVSPFPKTPLPATPEAFLIAEETPVKPIAPSGALPLAIAAAAFLLLGS